MQTRTQNPIWTIGHSTMPAGEFIDLLKKNQIDLVVDVRTTPYSRFASQFNKPELTHVLDRCDIGYRFEGKRMGGRPDDPTCYRDGAVPVRAERADFLKLVDYEAVKRKVWFQQALAAIIDSSVSHNVALMCSEEDPYECHRHRLIGSALNDRAIKVIHIRRRDRPKQAVFAQDPILEQVSLF